jgi:hypothetical protein
MEPGHDVGGSSPVTFGKEDNICDSRVNQELRAQVKISMVYNLKLIWVNSTLLILPHF